MSTTYEYRVVTAGSAGDLSLRVSGELEAGWELYGNLCLSTCAQPHRDIHIVYAQSLVKKVERRGPYD